MEVGATLIPLPLPGPQSLKKLTDDSDKALTTSGLMLPICLETVLPTCQTAKVREGVAWGSGTA